MSQIHLLPSLAEEAVEQFKLNPRAYSRCVGYLTVRCWVNPGSGPITWKIVQEPRSIIVMAPDWYVHVDLDSTEEQWTVYTRGDLSTHEQEWHALLDNKDKAWHHLRPAWIRDLARRGALLVQTRKGYPERSSTTTRTHLSPRQDAPQEGTSSSAQSTVPKFGTSQYASRSSRRKRRVSP